MVQYLLTGLAGAALAIVAMRIWHSREAAPQEPLAEPADVAERPVPVGAASSRNLLIGAGVLCVLAAAIIVFRSDDKADGVPIPLGAPSGSQQSLDDVDTMIARLAERLEKNPADGEGFRMLGWSYVMTGKPDKAIAPYKRALELLPNNALVHAGYGEALVGVAGGKVTPEARSQFDRALKIDPTEPRARNFEALWLSQNGNERQALDQWIALVNAGPADAPWQADVRRQIDIVAKKLGLDVAGKIKTASAGTLFGPDPSAVQSAEAMPAEDRQAMIDGMVEGLAEKLKSNPKNPEGWARLLRSRMVLGQTEQAGKDLAAARKALADNPVGLKMVLAVAVEVHVPGA